MKPPRIAYCSPVNPAPSGISDYSEELLPYLAQYADVTLYVESHLTPSNPLLGRWLEVRPLRRLARDQRRRPYDAILYHMGNSPVHAEIWTMAQRLPGVVVLHDFVLHHFMLWYAANVQGSVQAYVEMMRTRYGDDGYHIAQLMIRGRFTPTAFHFPCCEPVLRAARALITHSRYVQQQATQLRPSLPSTVVPMGIPLSPIAERAAARTTLGLPADALILASFGHINAYKRQEQTLRALRTLIHDYPTLLYLLVGSISPHFDIRGLVDRMGLSNHVHITGYAPRATFETAIAAADICLNLRHPTAGETSASLLRLLGAGRPTLVSATGAFTELPPGVVAHVDPDASETDLILAYCRLLITRPDVAGAMGESARTYVAHHHHPDGAAQTYIRFLAAHYHWPAVVRYHHEPRWEPMKSTPHAPPSPLVLASAPASAPHVSRSAIMANVAQALVEMGATEYDDALLQTVATRLAELGGVAPS